MPLKRLPLRYAHAEGQTDICYSEDGSRIVTCGSDGDIRVWKGHEDDDPTSHCVGEWALAVCYKNSRVHVAVDNHSVQTYTYPSFDKDGIVTRFTGPVTQIFSSPCIDVLACASEDMTAKICCLDGGAPLNTLSPHYGPILSISICPNKMFAATSSGDGVLRLWTLKDNSIIKEINCVPKVNTLYSAKVLCRTNFEPKNGKYFAYPDNHQVIILKTKHWKQKFSFTHSQIKCAISICLFSPCGNYIAASTVAGQIAIWNLITASAVGLTEHPTSHNICSMAWNPTGNKELAFCDVIGQLGMVIDDLINITEEKSDDESAQSNNVNCKNDDTLIDGPINYESDDYENTISLEKNNTLGDNAGSRVGIIDAVPPAPVSIPPQPSFQPSSTPLRLENRYMCWNDIGVVRCYTSPNGKSTIDVEFHDVSFHHRIHLNNYLNHTMASLSKTVLVLGCETPSKMVCIALLRGSKEWSVSMPETEEILCVTATTHLVACATDARLLRLFTPLGTQREVISLAGPVVCLSGYNSLLLAIYHRMDPGISDQHLGMDLFYAQNQQIKCKTVSVPLTPSSKLVWFGTSDTGSPCAYDSDGVLRTYLPSNGIWIPICDTSAHSKGSSDSWFIVSVSESFQSLRAVLCRGTTFPLTTPLPIISLLPLQLPFCEIDTEKSQYEEQLTKWSQLNTDTTVRTIQETVLKLFALACRNELEHRAVELMDLIHDEDLMPLAIRYASRRGSIHLADKLSNIAEMWSKEDSSARREAFDDVEVGENGVSSSIVGESHSSNVSVVFDINGGEKDKEASTPIRPLKFISKSKSSQNPFKKITVESQPTSSPTDNVLTATPDSDIKFISKPKSSQNPFKKLTVESQPTSSPLSLTGRVLVKNYTDNVPTAVADSDIIDMTPAPAEIFMEWFEKHKPQLEKEHPELAPSELTKLSVKIFRKYKTLKTNTDVAQKRTLDDVDRENEPTTSSYVAVKQSKLSDFAFRKKS